MTVTYKDISTAVVDLGLAAKPV
ncbi:MAG: hypothetical protein K0Q59_5462, partial [Paenibacillus sp.]|nr:hypothetical protein [Paenibacillus sp.]